VTRQSDSHYSFGIFQLLHWWKNISHCSFGETLPYHILGLKYYFSIPAILG